MCNNIIFSEIQGYVRTPFESAEVVNNQGVHIGSYGCGAISDGTYKLQVYVENFSNDIHSEPGMKIEIVGNVIK